MLQKIIFSLINLLVLFSCSNKFQNLEKTEYIQLRNPIIPGYFADPSIVQYDGKFYLYATADPWGEDFLACWVSSNLRDWTFHKLNWPTKEACTSPLSNSNMVWAPSVVKKGEKFYMYVSVGSEIWCGVADHPVGPWSNPLGNKQLIEFDTTKYCHTIDAEVFIDDNDRAYLYWGSGWNWVNGRCYVAELNDDMYSFKSEKKEITPNHYFEGPFVNKYNSKYYMTYSEGRTMDDTYEVRYAVSDSPMGTFIEAKNSPILKTNAQLDVYGPGHHTLFSYDNKNYILYHRHRLPFVTETAYRQICINDLEFNKKSGLIKNINPHNTQQFPSIKLEKHIQIEPLSINTSSQHSRSSYLSDKNYATRWEADDLDRNNQIIASFKPDTSIKYLNIRFEYPWKTYYPKVEYTSDGETWELATDHWEEGVSGSPVNISINKNILQLKISFNPEKVIKNSIWELEFY